MFLPVHYWLRWTQLFQGGGSGIVLGLVAQAAAVTVVLTAAYVILSRRDPAA